MTEPQASWEDEDGILVRAVTTWTFFDGQRWSCRCSRYRDEGRCRHLARWRPQVTVWALDIYL